MAWKKARDPLAPVPPAFHHPERCMNCGHLGSEHDPDVGCLMEGGTKYLLDEQGNERRTCSCETFVPAPPEEASNVIAPNVGLKNVEEPK